MNTDSYRIGDEPSPGALSAIAVNPFWPFVAIMFGGAWLSWSWFLLNSAAVGSPTRTREYAWILAGIIGSAILTFFVLVLAAQDAIKEEHIKYALLIVTTWKLGVTYALYSLQNHTIDLYEYYGGKLANGIYFVIAGALASPFVLSALPPYFRLILN